MLGCWVSNDRSGSSGFVSPRFDFSTAAERSGEIFGGAGRLGALGVVVVGRLILNPFDSAQGRLEFRMTVEWCWLS